MAGADLKVLFIMGLGRCGSTILDNLLGELDGFFSLGEFHNLWARGVVDGQLCGCRSQVRECDVWSAVLRAVFDASPTDPVYRRIVRWQEETVRVRHTRKLLRQEPGSPSGWEALDEYVGVLGRVYRAVAQVTGARVLVDSSKRPEHGALLHLVDGIRPYFVHMVRDPRAAAFSRQRRKSTPHGEMARYGPVRVASRWMSRNLASHMVRRRHGTGRSLLVRYEDFIASPPSTILRIAELVEERPSRLPFQDENTARLGVNHAVSGNPSRFETGTVKLRLDDEWKSGQGRMDRVVSTAMTLPFLPWYRYPIFPGRTSSRA